MSAVQDSTSNLKPSPQRRSVLRRCLGAFQLGLASLGLVILLFCLTPIIVNIYPRLDRRDPLAHADYIVCLGGDPYRVLEAVQLLTKWYAPQLAVSQYGASA